MSEDYYFINWKWYWDYNDLPDFVYLFSDILKSIPKMGRKFIVGGNWKMNGDKKAIDGIIDFLKKGPLDPNVGK